MTFDKDARKLHNETSLNKVLVLFLYASEADFLPLKQHLYPLLSPFEQAKIDKYRVANAAVLSMAGKYLLLKGLQYFKLSPPINLADLDYSEFKRPIISPNIDFNISHSGDMVSCALCPNFTIGYDIEEIKPNALSDFRIVFTAEEIQQIKAAPNPMIHFFRYWTQKEAVMKGDGRGFYLPPKEIRLNGSLAFAEKQTWHLHTIDLVPNYAAHLAIQTPEKLDILVQETKYDF